MLLLLVVEHFIFQMEHLENRVGKVSGVLSAWIIHDSFEKVLEHRALIYFFSVEVCGVTKANKPPVNKF